MSDALGISGKEFTKYKVGIMRLHRVCARRMRRLSSGDMNTAQLFRHNCPRYQVIQLQRLADWLTNGENDLVALVTRNVFELHFIIRFYSMAPDGYRTFLDRADVEKYFNLFNLGNRDWDNRPEMIKQLLFCKFMPFSQNT